MGPNKEREVPIRIIYRKKGHAAAHHGGAWKVAFADFMTAMFALFLVLWLINQSSDVKSAIAGYFQDPLGRADEFGSSILPGDGAQASVARPLKPMDIVDLRRDRLQNMQERLESALDKVPDLKTVREKIEISVTDEGLQIQLLEDSLGVFFESGNAKPSMRGETILALLGHELRALPNPVMVAGYTDARPYRSRENYSNWELSADRANAARRILTDAGLAGGQIVQIRGFADRDLRDPANPLAASNRRVTVTMLFGRVVSDPATGARPRTPTALESAAPDSTRIGAGA